MEVEVEPPKKTKSTDSDIRKTNSSLSLLMSPHQRPQPHPRCKNLSLCTPSSVSAATSTPISSSSPVSYPTSASLSPSSYSAVCSSTGFAPFSYRCSPSSASAYLHSSSASSSSVLSPHDSSSTTTASSSDRLYSRILCRGVVGCVCGCNGGGYGRLGPLLTSTPAAPQGREARYESNSSTAPFNDDVDPDDSSTLPGALNSGYDNDEHDYVCRKYEVIYSEPYYIAPGKSLSSSTKKVHRCISAHCGGDSKYKLC